MFKESKFYLGWQKLCKDLKPMTFTQKLDHLWTYYKEVLWLGGLALLVVAVIIASLINGGKDVLVSGMFVNIKIDQAGYNYLDSEYFAELGGDPKKHVDILIDYSNFGDMADPTNHEDNSAQAMILYARVEGEYMDYGLLDQLALEYYMPNEVFMDLRELFSQDQLDALGKSVIWAREQNSEEAIPLAIDISALPFAKDNHINDGKPVYFVVSTRTRRPKMCMAVWERINAWDAKK